MIHVCVPVLKRYDLLRGLLLSLKASTSDVKVHIIDNGLRGERLTYAMQLMGLPFEVYTPEEPLGVAASWNTFIASVPEDRVIANDDVIFAPRSLEQLVAVDADIAWAEGCGFSCFLLRNSCVEKIGLFDATISPGYAYYEDDDYLQRIDGRGTREPSVKAMNVECGVQHLHSATLRAATQEEMQEHHRKFKIAQANYIKKWGLEQIFEQERLQREVGR